MNLRVRKTLLFSISYAFLGGCLLFVSCGSRETILISESQKQTGCDAGAALIGVYEASLTILCGCDEAAGTTAVKPSTLTCTMAAGGTLTFSFQDKTRKHQILSKGPKSFSSSPIFDPESDVPIVAHGIKISETGTYAFQDSFDSTLGGQIISR